MEVAQIKIYNVILLGVAFMLIFTGFQTMGNIQTTILKTASSDKNSTGYVPGFSGNGYTSLAIIYSVFSLANWFAPSVIAVLGPKFTLLLGGVFYSLFVAQIVYPNDYLLYAGSVIIGIGAAIIWTAQGNFLTINSDPETMTRNSGLFWAMLQCSNLIGNTFVFFVFNGLESIDKNTRTLVVLVLLGVCAVGTLVFLFLRRTPWAAEIEGPRETPMDALRGAVRLFFTKWMLVLCLCFFYTGVVLTFWSGVYGTSIGNTKSFGKSAKSLVGIHGIFVGLGEMIGGLLFGILGHILVNKGRDPIVVLGFISHMVSFFLVFMNIPNDAPFGDTTSQAFMESNRYLAIFCSFILGFGDSCFNTQVFSILGGVWSDNSAPAFAIFKFVQSTSAAVAFYYSNVLELYYQLLILVILCVVGTLAFCWVEWETGKEAALLKIKSGEEDNSCGVVQDEEIQEQRNIHISDKE